MKTKMEDIVFWILILAAIGIILWLLSGSPTTESALVAIGLFIISSEIFLWKKYFAMDKNAAVSFTRLKNDLSNLTIGQKAMNDKLNNIEKLLKQKI